MVIINPTTIIDKYKKSIDGWLLPLPIKEDGVYKIRMFMNRKTSEKDYDGEAKLEFGDVYTYSVPSLEYLVKFFMMQSYGQAYHGLFRLIQKRTDFIMEENHESGYFLMEKVMKSSFLGSSPFVCAEIQEEFDKIGFEFNLNPISDADRKSVDEILIEVALLFSRKDDDAEDEREIRQQEEELLDMGYDY